MTRFFFLLLQLTKTVNHVNVFDQNDSSFIFWHSFPSSILWINHIPINPLVTTASVLCTLIPYILEKLIHLPATGAKTRNPSQFSRSWLEVNYAEQYLFFLSTFKPPAIITIAWRHIIASNFSYLITSKHFYFYSVILTLFIVSFLWLNFIDYFSSLLAIITTRHKKLSYVSTPVIIQFLPKTWSPHAQSSLHHYHTINLSARVSDHESQHVLHFQK
jgi:hypothetical protein